MCESEQSLGASEARMKLQPFCNREILAVHHSPNCVQKLSTIESTFAFTWLLKLGRESAADYVHGVDCSHLLIQNTVHCRAKAFMWAFCADEVILASQTASVPFEIYLRFQETTWHLCFTESFFPTLKSCFCFDDIALLASFSSGTILQLSLSWVLLLYACSETPTCLESPSRQCRFQNSAKFNMIEHKY